MKPNRLPILLGLSTLSGVLFFSWPSRGPAPTSTLSPASQTVNRAALIDRGFSSPELDPSSLPLPEIPDFAENTFSVTEGAIIAETAPTPTTPASDHPSHLRERPALFPKELFRKLAHLSSDSPLPELRLPLFDGEAVDVQFTAHQITGAGEGSLIGVIKGTRDGHVTLGYSGEAQAGTIQLSPTEAYSLFHTGNGQHRLVEVDMKSLPPCAGEPHSG